MSCASDVLADLCAHPDAALSVRTGIEHWHTGQITLRARGDGQAVVHNVRSGEQRTFEGMIEPGVLGELGRHVTRVGSAPVVTHRVPGDQPVRIAVERGGETLLVLDRWHADRYADDGLHALLTLADRLVAELTGGELPFGRR
jgi:hypothetical protein